MTITQITENKKQYLDLLLLADEQESMIDRYLERGELFVLEDEGVKAVGVVTDEGSRIPTAGIWPEADRLPVHPLFGKIHANDGGDRRCAGNTRILQKLRV